MNINEQNTYRITLDLTTDADPNKWNWAEMLELNKEETLHVEIGVK